MEVMSDTPETDEQINGKPCTRFAVLAGDSLQNAMVASEFARNLERQRNDALQLARELGDALLDSHKRLNKFLNRPGGAMAIHDSMLVAKCERVLAKAEQQLCN
jgi:hypothetical protein